MNGPGPDAEAGAGIDAGPAFAGPGARARGARLTDAEPRLAGARVRLDGERVVWSREDAEAAPSAGTGIPSAVVDLVLGAGDEVGAGIGADADARADGGAVAFAGALAAAAGDPERERAIPVDQTHVSVIVDECWVVKIVGSWGAADRSAAILERLRAAGSTATPAFVGALEWQHPDRGSSALALVSAYVPDSDDGWTWAVDDALAHLARGAAKPDWPARLGALAAEMHTALRIEPTEAHAAPDPRAGDRARARAVHERAFAAIDAVGSAAAVAAPGSTAAGGLDGSARGSAGFAVRMRARREALAAAIGTIPDRSDAPSSPRTATSTSARSCAPATAAIWCWTSTATRSGAPSSGSAPTAPHAMSPTCSSPSISWPPSCSDAWAAPTSGRGAGRTRRSRGSSRPTKPWPGARCSMPRPSPASWPSSC
ncbi:hypothetical protein [Leucobacter soli]|uniref:hypothetical protein n=1 Tax=Leucobacter soli TaxID=2812850 RepID=UPI00361F0DBA